MDKERFMGERVEIMKNIVPVWQWEWQEGVGAAISTFRVAAKLCEQFDSFILNHNEAILYMSAMD